MCIRPPPPSGAFPFVFQVEMSVVDALRVIEMANRVLRPDGVAMMSRSSSWNQLTISLYF